MNVLRNCARAIIIRDGKILAAKYADESGEYYALPGGGQMHGETLPQALIRECREELGISLRNYRLCFIREYIGKYGESSWRDSHVHQVEFLYGCEIAAEDEPVFGAYSDQDMVDIAWLPIAVITKERFYPRTLVEYLGKPLPAEVEYWGMVE